MISLASIVEVVTGSLPDWVAFLGNKNFAMSVGAIIALYLWASALKLGKQELWSAISKPLEIAGVIILITSAGGAYGAMIKHSGIGDAITLAIEGFSVHYVLLAWLIAAGHCRPRSGKCARRRAFGHRVSRLRAHLRSWTAV